MGIDPGVSRLGGEIATHNATSASLRSLVAAERTAAEINNLVFMRFCVFCMCFECACQLQTGIIVYLIVESHRPRN